MVATILVAGSSTGPSDSGASHTTATAISVWCSTYHGYTDALAQRSHDYLLRATLTDFLAQLDPAQFVRVHRSHAVNLGRIREIEPLDGGDARLHMHDGTSVPCSRRYRDALRSGALVR